MWSSTSEYCVRDNSNIIKTSITSLLILKRRLTEYGIKPFGILRALACCGRRVSHVNKGNANDQSVQNVFSRSALNVSYRFASVPLEILLLPFLFSLPRSCFRRPTSPFNYYIFQSFWPSSVSSQVIQVAFSSWRIFALFLVISKVSLLSLVALLLTLNFGWSGPLRFTGIWFDTSPLSLLFITNTSRHSTKSCLSDLAISFTKKNSTKGY